jgi:hypothetical protein
MIKFIRQSTVSTTESQSPKHLTEQIYDLELRATEARIQDNSVRKLHTEALEHRTSQKDRHIRKPVDFEASYTKPKDKSKRASRSPAASVVEGTRRNLSSDRVANASVLMKGISFSNSPVKPYQSNYQDSSPGIGGFSREAYTPSVRPILPRPSTSSSRRSSTRQTTERLFMLNAIQCACESVVKQDHTEQELRKGIRGFKEIKQSIEWTSSTLNQIDGCEADLMAFQYNYFRNQRDSLQRDKASVGKEYRTSSLDPNRPIAKIERSMKRSRGRFANM